MSTSEKRRIIGWYSSRMMWISEIARALDVSYESVRQVLVEAGYFRGKKL